jgi:hypothetical protein
VTSDAWHSFGNDADNAGNGSGASSNGHADYTGANGSAGEPANGPVADLASDLVETEPEAIIHLRTAMQSGVPWPRALLEAVGLWTAPLEVHRGRTYRYLIQGEALDWLTLAERLCAEIQEIANAAPTAELERLLFEGTLPEDVTPEDFRDWMGGNKHRAYLNYWYGVVVEEALQQAVEDDVRKREKARCYPDHEEMVEEAFAHLYGKPRAELLKEFRKEPQIANHEPLSLADCKEFNYWLSKLRFNLWDPARVASDTRKGMRYLNGLEQVPGPLVAEEAGV